MTEASFILGLAGFVFGVIGLIMGCVSVSMVCGFLRSTHTIQWKPLETKDPFVEDEDFEEPVGEFVEKKKVPKKTDFAFMEEVSDQSNF